MAKSKNRLSLVSEELVQVLRNLAYGWLLPGFGLIQEICGRRRDRRELQRNGHTTVRCQVVPSTVYKRPDPMIYSQQYLMAQGLAVTWDNPDIVLYLNGNPVSSSALIPATEYEVRARIWNGSNEAPAINMAVDFSFLTFGIGTTSTAIGRTRVDLPVRGAPGHPAFARMKWKTPATPGHYCLQVKLNWEDDANPNNNLGQENTNVGVFKSPAVFEFPVFNAEEWPEHITLKADTYTLPTPIDCAEVVNGRLFYRDYTAGTRLTGPEICKILADRQKDGLFPVPADWTVDIKPSEFDLASKASINVKVTITPPASFSGTQAFNINAYNKQNVLIGGITLYTKR